MKVLRKYRKEFTNLILVVCLAFFSGCCALGVTRVHIAHDPLDPVENKREGNIFVKQFVDKREDIQYIGNKRNCLGIVMGHIGTKEVELEALLTNFIAEALKEAGYNAVVQETSVAGIPGQVKFDGIVDGEIVEFWLDLYMMVWHNVGVIVRARDPIDQHVLWEKDIRGGRRNILWFGATSEYENIIRQALTEALNQAAKEFSSDEFYNAVKK